MPGLMPLIPSEEQLTPKSSEFCLVASLRLGKPLPSMIGRTWYVSVENLPMTTTCLLARQVEDMSGNMTKYWQDGAATSKS